MPVKDPIKMTYEEWVDKAKELFGDDPMQWKFVCPSCGHVTSVQDWADAGADEGEVAFSCVGRALGSQKRLGEKPGPCNYAGGGLFGLNPVHVEFEDGGVQQTFAFAEEGSDDTDG